MVPPQWLCVKNVKTVNKLTITNKKNSRYIKYREFFIIEIKSIRIIQPLPLQQRSQQPLQVHQPSL